MGPTRHGRKIVLSGDTAPCEAIALAAHQADVLVHEGTFTEQESQRAHETGHSTARQAARLASSAQVGMLALVHLSTRYSAGEVQREARLEFAATVLPRDFDTIEVPYPERGQAQLQRWADRPRPAQGTAETSAAAPESTQARASLAADTV
jgi:ribonuclease Z